MTYFLLLVWVGVQAHSPISAPTTLGPFTSIETCRAVEGQVIQMAADMSNSIPVRGAQRATLVHWRCVSVP